MPVEHPSITMLTRELGKVPIELRRRLRPALRDSAADIVSDMKSRASYSSRIPGAIRLSVSFAKRRGGVHIRVNSKRAPHARVLERGNDGSRSTTFRHPVFGDKEVWVSQPTQPFFFPAIQAGRAGMRRKIAAAVAASLPGGTR